MNEPALPWPPIAPGDPSAAPGDPSAAPGDASAAPGDPSAAPGEDPAAPGAGPVAPGDAVAPSAPGDPSLAPGDAVEPSAPATPGSESHPWSDGDRPRGLDAYFAPGGEDAASPERLKDERRLTWLLVLMVCLLVGVPTLLTLIAFAGQILALHGG